MKFYGYLVKFSMSTDANILDLTDVKTARVIRYSKGRQRDCNAFSNRSNRFPRFTDGGSKVDGDRCKTNLKRRKW